MATFYETALDRQGNALSGVDVTVYTDAALTTKASLTDTDGNAIGNPVTTNDDGFFAFSAAAATYTLGFARNGVTVRGPLTIQVGGAQGNPGTAGATILAGTGAPSGGLGANGDFYYDTAASRFYGPKTAGAWGAGTSLIGSTGAGGNTILSGSGAPGAGTGANGDFYINTTASSIYGPKTAGAWGSPTSLIGPGGAGTGDMLKANNLSELPSPTTALSNLGLSANGKSLVTAADYAAMKILLGLVISANVQAYNANLTTFAGIAPSANVQTLLGAASFSAFRTSLGVAIGTDVQAYNANLTTFAAIAPAANVVSLLGAANYAAMRTQLGLVIGTNVQAWSAVLDAIAADANNGVKPTESIIIAASDEATAITAGTGKVTFRMPYAFTVTAVRASLLVAQTSGSIFTVDINESGTSIISTKLTIDNTEKTSTTAATPVVISDASLADDAEMTVDIDQVGSGTAKGLKIILIGHR